MGGVGEVRMSPGKRKVQDSRTLSMKHPWKYGAQGLERQHAPCAVPCSVGLPAKGQRQPAPRALLIPLEVHFQGSRILSGSDEENPEYRIQTSHGCALQVLTLAPRLWCRVPVSKFCIHLCYRITPATHPEHHAFSRPWLGNVCPEAACGRTLD